MTRGHEQRAHPPGGVPDPIISTPYPPPPSGYGIDCGGGGDGHGTDDTVHLPDTTVDLFSLFIFVQSCCLLLWHAIIVKDVCLFHPPPPSPLLPPRYPHDNVGSEQGRTHRGEAYRRKREVGTHFTNLPP